MTAASATAAVASLTSTAQVSHTVASSVCFYLPVIQSGTTTSTANGTRTVTITSVTTTKAFLIFNLRSNLNRPVAFEIGGRIASATTIEFIRNTNEGSPVTINIQWYVIEYICGVTVQRGSLTQAATTNNVTITAVAATSQAFVTWSKTAAAADTGWNNNDPIVGVLTSTTNLQFRVNAAAAGHTIYWQVIEFTDSTKINVQTGTTSLTGAATSTTVTLGTAVTTSRTFLLVAARSSPSGSNISSGLVRGRVISTTQITLDRSTASYDATEIVWQVIELKDGSKVQSGTNTLGTGTASATPALTAVNTTRATAFGSMQAGGGQSTGRTSYATDDVLGVASGTFAISSSTQLTITRTSTAGSTDLAWFVVEWGRPTGTSNPK